MRLGTWRDLYRVGDRHYWGGTLVGLGAGFAIAPQLIFPRPHESVVFFGIGMFVTAIGHWVARLPRGSEVNRTEDSAP